MMEQWIHIPQWETLQYRSDQELPWIKFYTRLTGKQKWISLTLAERGLLASLWQEYAKQNSSRNASEMLQGLPRNTSEISRRIGQKCFEKQLVRLNQGELIEFSAHFERTKCAAQCAPEVEVEEEFPPNPPQVGDIEIWDSEKHDYVKPGSRASGTNPRAVADELERARKLKRLAEIRLGRAREQYAIWVEDLGLKFAEHTLRDAFPDLADTILKESA